LGQCLVMEWLDPKVSFFLPHLDFMASRLPTHTPGNIRFMGQLYIMVHIQV
jgi:hypothetical protein